MIRKIRPKVLIDIQKYLGSFSNTKSIVQLHPLKHLWGLHKSSQTWKTVAAIVAILYIISGSQLIAPTTLPNTYAAEQVTADERKALESELANIEKQINEYEGKISDYQKQGSSLQGEIKKLNNNIALLNLQIKAIGITLSKLDGEIADNQSQIDVLADKIDKNRQTLKTALQTVYENDGEALLTILLKHNNLNDFYTEVNDLGNFQAGIINVIEDFLKTKDDLGQKQEDLTLKKADATSIKQYRDNQKNLINKTKSERAQLLSLVKNQETLYQGLAKEKKEAAAKIRQRIFQFLGGGQLSFDKAVDLATTASHATGVRAALILAVLDHESALGQNTGRCDYKTAMHPTRDLPIFLDLLAQLKTTGQAPPEPITVSCANSDGAYGGAMGPAQFIPSTWKLYQDKIQSVTGHNPPSPWNNADAFVATALYLKDAGAVAGATVSQERQAAARYYAGARWSRYLWTYGERVIQKAAQFENDIKLISES